ncbi:hypothetical protein ACJ73_03003 [Blastomyces percursus]|uniref:Uncharacterized protein n=1 Tax=Blastomyces percursus TaxID=1658174 RepID=A0A1J9RAT5_9EURO|nr:hypothetical protein ACJ73_03003 [Blastomyces percursus]
MYVRSSGRLLHQLGITRLIISPSFVRYRALAFLGLDRPQDPYRTLFIAGQQLNPFAPQSAVQGSSGTSWTRRGVPIVTRTSTLSSYNLVASTACRGGPSFRPFPECRRVPGHFGGACSNCKWWDHAARCSVRDGGIEVVDLDDDDDYDKGGPQRQMGPPGQRLLTAGSTPAAPIVLEQLLSPSYGACVRHLGMTCTSTFVSRTSSPYMAKPSRSQIIDIDWFFIDKPIMSYEVEITAKIACQTRWLK